VWQTAIDAERTAATAPLSLASVKISSDSEASVELPSQETRAIQGVMAGNGRDKQGVPKRPAERIHVLVPFVRFFSPKWTSAP